MVIYTAITKARWKSMTRFERSKVVVANLACTNLSVVYTNPTAKILLSIINDRQSTKRHSDDKSIVEKDIKTWIFLVLETPVQTWQGQTWQVFYRNDPTVNRPMTTYDNRNKFRVLFKLFAHIIGKNYANRKHAQQSGMNVNNDFGFCDSASARLLRSFALSWRRREISRCVVRDWDAF